MSRPIPSDFIQRLRDNIVMSELLVDEYGIELKKGNKKGNDYMACCPFHDDDTASLSIDDEKGLFHCFGCGATGNQLSLLTEIQQVPFRKAVIALSKRVGVNFDKEMDEYYGSHQSNRNIISQRARLDAATQICTMLSIESVDADMHRTFPPALKPISERSEQIYQLKAFAGAFWSGEAKSALAKIKGLDEGTHSAQLSGILQEGTFSYPSNKLLVPFSSLIPFDDNELTGLLPITASGKGTSSILTNGFLVLNDQLQPISLYPEMIEENSNAMFLPRLSVMETAHDEFLVIAPDVFEYLELIKRGVRSTIAPPSLPFSSQHRLLLEGLPYLQRLFVLSDEELNNGAMLASILSISDNMTFTPSDDGRSTASFIYTKDQSLSKMLDANPEIPITKLNQYAVSAGTVIKAGLKRADDLSTLLPEIEKQISRRAKRDDWANAALLCQAVISSGKRTRIDLISNALNLTVDEVKMGEILSILTSSRLSSSQRALVQSNLPTSSMAPIYDIVSALYNDPAFTKKDVSFSLSHFNMDNACLASYQIHQAIDEHFNNLPIKDEILLARLTELETYGYEKRLSPN